MSKARARRVRSYASSIIPETGRVVTALPEVLVASRALLAVPTLLVDNHDGGQDGEAFNSERNVGKVGNGAVPVLEIEGVEKLFGLLLSNFLQRLLHRERRARVLGHGIGLDLGLNAVNGEYFDGGSGGGGAIRGCGLG